MFGPMFDAGVFVKEFEKGNVSEYMEKISRQEQAEQTRKAVEAALSANPEATHQQIADVVGIDRSRFTPILAATTAVVRSGSLAGFGGSAGLATGVYPVDVVGCAIGVGTGGVISAVWSCFGGGAITCGTTTTF